MSEFVGGVTIRLTEDVAGVLTACVETVPGTETDPEMVAVLAASALVDAINSVEDQKLLPNRAARRRAVKRQR